MTEIYVYHSYSPATKWQSFKIKLRLLKLQALILCARVLLRARTQKKARLSRTRRQYVQSVDLSPSLFFVKMARAFALFSLVILFVSFAPSLWYVAKAALYGDKTPQLLAQTVDTSKSFDSQKVKRQVYQPKIVPSLSNEGRLVIPTIGVDTQIHEATYENYEEALKRGVWRVSDFGTPYDRERPTILAAHRYGYLKWSNLFRRQNSFYNLPKLAPGDIVEVSWRQRKYVFEVYAEEKADMISNYSADLILYTCESLNSPVRIIKYARILEI